MVAERKPRTQRKPNSVHRAGGLTQSPVAPTDAHQAELDARILSLRKAGATYAQIAADVRLSPTAVRQHFLRLIDELVPVEDVGMMRRLELDRLDEIRHRVWAAIMGGDIGDPVDRYLRISAAYARLAGLAMPERHVLEVQVTEIKTQVTMMLVSVLDRAGLDGPSRLRVLDALEAAAALPAAN